MLSYPLTQEAKETELNIIRNTLLNNQYSINVAKKSHKKGSAHIDTQTQKTQWATFTYSGKEVRKITKLFRDTQIKIAFRTTNTIQNILKHQPPTDKFNRSGIYQMKCLDCPLKYIGQTGRAFNIRYTEKLHDIRHNNNSGYANHILNTGHTYGTIEDTMEVIRKGQKGKNLNTVEKYYIHNISKSNLHMNDTYNDTYKPIFETLHNFHTR
jgi:hypothetical protein